VKIGRIHLPSGDQLGTELSVTSMLSLVGTPPAGSTVYRFDSPPNRESKAIRPPSGDQRGVPLITPKEVSWRTLDPSPSQTQISMAPLRSDSNAILPSGEMLADSWSAEETIRLCACASFT
jgi:hypothetical protein